MSPQKKATAPLVEPEHIRHGIPLLQLLTSQLQSAIADNNQTMTELTEAYAAIATTTQPIIEKQLSHPAQQRLHKEMGRMLIAFQGHDAFNQRIEHINNTLEAFCTQLADATRRDLDTAWEQLTEELSSNYTTTQERRIHDKVKRHADDGRDSRYSAAEAEPGSVELF